jgi:hypothetical protein
VAWLDGLVEILVSVARRTINHPGATGREGLISAGHFRLPRMIMILRTCQGACLARSPACERRAAGDLIPICKRSTHNSLHVFVE